MRTGRLRAPSVGLLHTASGWIEILLRSLWPTPSTATLVYVRISSLEKEAGFGSSQKVRLARTGNHHSRV